MPTTVNDILKDWSEKRDKMKVLDEEIKDIKKRVEKLLDKNGSDTIKGKDHIVSRTHQTKEYLSKKDVPLEIWDKYKKKTNYDVLSLRAKR